MQDHGGLGMEQLKTIEGYRFSYALEVAKVLMYINFIYSVSVVFTFYILVYRIHITFGC